MYDNISKTLEAIIARVAFHTTKTAINHHLKDRLTLAILEEEGSLAYQLLTGRMQPWELYQLRLRIEQACTATLATPESTSQEEFFRHFCTELIGQFPHVKRISTAHALIALADDPFTATKQLFARYRITADILRDELKRIEEGRLAHDELSAPMRSLLQSEPVVESRIERYGTDLTRAAREGRLDPIIGRDREIERLIQILSRRKKNNPVLLGEAGVGKTAIVEGLALRMAEGHVPHALRDRRLIALNLSTLIAGTKFRGEFEERMQQLIEELQQTKQIILFIDELHTLVGAGATQGSLDAANILKPALARGDLQLIGATTFDEYRRDIEHDSALERRFQRVVIEPPTSTETLRMLEQLAPSYERHHRVRYTPEALRAIVNLAERYLTERSFPDKAIDLMDEAGTRVHLQALAEESHQTIEQQRYAALEAGHYETATALRVEELQQHTDSIPIAEVGVAAIEALVATMTGIPTTRLKGDEIMRLQGLKSHLEQRVIGQQEAVRGLSQAILRARSGLHAAHRPIGVFLFVGPTGVGKTLLAKELSKWLFDEDRGLIRLDMSEYSEKHNVARLLGSPPGYVGYGEGGQLTEAVRRRPYAVVLLDEIEKAHPEVFNTLLQLFDEGHLTDGAGRKVDFRNTVIIMTSNVGSRQAADQPNRVGYTTHHTPRGPRVQEAASYRKSLEQMFAPEFLNRIDEVVLFRALGREEMEQILQIELQSLTARAERLGITLQISTEAMQTLLAEGYDARFGARALKRALTSRIETPLSELIVTGSILPNTHILVEHTPTAGITLRVA